MKQFITILVTFILGVVSTIVLKDNSSLNEALSDINNYWNTNISFTNFGIIITTVITAVLSYINQKKTEENANIKVDIQSVSPEVQEIKQTLNVLVTAFTSLVNSAKIPTNDKVIINQILAHVNTQNLKPMIETAKQVIIEETKEAVTEIKESYIEKLAKQINNK